MRKFILSITILVSVLSAKVYNTPFINVDETIQLQEGMSRQDVLNKIGDPFYVQSGEMGIIVWMYEVRTIEVQSDSPIGEEVIPNKTHSNYKHTGPIHRLEVVFVDNKLASWGMTKEKIKKKSLPSVNIAVAKASSLQISPHLQLGSALGGGLSVYKGNIGVGIHASSGSESESTPNGEMEWDYDNDMYVEQKDYTNTEHTAMTIMGQYNKSISSFVIGISAGLSFITTEIENDTMHDGHHMYDESTTQTYLSIGVGKKFSVMNINIQPMIQGILYNEEVGVSALLRLNFML